MNNSLLSMVTKVTQAEIEGCCGEEDKKVSLGARREAGGDFDSSDWQEDARRRGSDSERVALAIGSGRSRLRLKDSSDKHMRTGEGSS